MICQDLEDKVTEWSEAMNAAESFRLKLVNFVNVERIAVANQKYPGYTLPSTAELNGVPLQFRSKVQNNRMG